MLLGGAGRTHFALHGDYTNENWFPEYDYAIGDAAGAETRDASGVHRRRFTNGLVLVNPTDRVRAGRVRRRLHRLRAERRDGRDDARRTAR